MKRVGKCISGVLVLCVGVTAASAAPPSFDGYASKPIDADAAIPGCDSVEQPSRGVSFGFGAYGADTYDSPNYPWYSGPKASAMSDALVDALPSNVLVDYAPRDQSFEFQPNADYSDSDLSGLPDGITAADLSGDARADGSVTSAGVTTTLGVTVQQTSRDIPPCTAGSVDERRWLGNGAVVDLLDTWDEYPQSDGTVTRRNTRSADGWRADGSLVQASLSSDTEGWPMTRDDLVDLVLAAGLQTTAPVPAGTQSPAMQCNSTYDDDGPYVKVTRELVERWNAALSSAWPSGVPGLELDRPLASLEPADAFLSGACAAFELTGPNTAGTVSISISSDHEMPTAPDPYDPSHTSALPTLTPLPDGSVEVVTDDGYRAEPFRRSVVTHPSGFAVDVYATGSNPPPVQLLRALASTPGLDGP